MTVNEKIKAGAYKNNKPCGGGALKGERSNRAAYHQEERRLMDLFKEDLLLELGLRGHPKAEKLWQMAWDHGHADGLQDVLYWAEDFAQLI